MSALAEAWLHSLLPIVALSCVAWVLCTLRHNVGLVDVFWPWFFLVAGGCHLSRSHAWPATSLVMAALVVAWALRLSFHLAIRNWHAPEDRRYAAMRARHQPGFAWKSLLYVFGFQAVLAWIVSAPLAAGLGGRASAGAAWTFGVALTVTGIVIETIADSQLTAFRSRERQAGAVLDTGLWRYSRHPNYFGECCVWWGLFAMVARADSLWLAISPLLMTYLLLRVSGVTLLERDIADRRPAYRAYVERTPAFIPWIPKSIDP